jgi:hypothetical protein
MTESRELEQQFLVTRFFSSLSVKSVALSSDLFSYAASIAFALSYIVQMEVEFATAELHFHVRVVAEQSSCHCRTESLVECP